MYKSRIWKWGLDKKLKGDEVLTILILKTERDAQGKPSDSTIRSQPVDLDNVNRYIRRNPSLAARFQAGITSMNSVGSTYSTVEDALAWKDSSHASAFAFAEAVKAQC